MYGSGTYGGGLYGGRTAAFDLIQTATDFFRSRQETRHQPWPWCQFYEVEVDPDTSTYLRVVDFADPHGGASPGFITFNGEEYRSIRINRQEIPQSLEGESPALAIEISDPLHEGAQYLADHGGLVGRKVRTWILPYDHVDEPDRAQKYTWRIKSTAVREGGEDGPAVVVNIGPPSLFDMLFPAARFNRRKCINAWPNRFRHATLKNYCPFPSDEFETNTRQRFSNASDAETAADHGWFTINATKVGIADWRVTGPANPTLDNEGFLSCDAGITSIVWNDGTRNGPFCYKKITGELEVDVEIKMFLLFADANDTEGFCGIGIQPIANQSKWAMWGQQHRDIGDGEVRLLYRHTTSDVSTDVVAFTEELGPTNKQATADAVDNAFRLQIVGQDVKLYSRFEDRSNKRDGLIDPPAWTLRYTHEGFDITADGELRVGLIFAGHDAADFLNARVHHFRFNKGGIATCNRTLTDCVARGMVIHYNGFPVLPDGISRASV